MFRKQKPYLRYLSKIYLPTPKPKREIRFPWKVIKIVFLMGILSVSGWFLFYSPYFMIKNVKVEGSKNEGVINLCQNIKGQNLWLFNKKKLEGNLLKYAEVRNVSIRRWPSGTVIVKIEEKIEGLIWKTQDKKYLVTSDGVVLKEVTESNLPEISDSKNLPVLIGKQVATPLFIQFVRDLSFNFMPKTGLVLKNIYIPSETTFEIVALTEHQGGSSFKVIFDTEGDLEKQLENMIKVYQIKQDEVKEYMDLRIEGRVYYK